MIRAMMSTPPPGVSGTITRTGREGHGASAACAAPQRDKAQGIRDKAIVLNSFMSAPLL
jgi:hypothetical protein